MSRFGGGFARRFCRVGYVCPVSAKDRLSSGAGVEYAGGVARIGGRVLIGSAGGVYRFASAGSFDTWCGAARSVLSHEQTLATADYAAGWREKKRARLQAMAERVLRRAARERNASKRAAMIEEASVCAGKWSE